MIPKLEQMKRLLWEAWDPIGVNAHGPEGEYDGPEDEYDSYAFRVFVMLNEGKGQTEIAEYLRWIETEHMGLNGSGRESDIAQKAIEIQEGQP